jgi:hypothetical protein
MLSVLLCSLDSFFGALGIGLIDRSKTNNRNLILAFGACDLIATLAGIFFRTYVAQIHLPKLALFTTPLFMAAAAVAVLIHAQKSPARLVSIPILLSLDNFLAGLSPASIHGVQSSVIAGLLSGLLAWSGFVTARGLGPVLSRRGSLVMSVGMTIIAFVFVG